MSSSLRKASRRRVPLLRTLARRNFSGSLASWSASLRLNAISMREGRTWKENSHMTRSPHTSSNSSLNPPCASQTQKKKRRRSEPPPSSDRSHCKRGTAVKMTKNVSLRLTALVRSMLSFWKQPKNARINDMCRLDCEGGGKLVASSFVVVMFLSEGYV